MDFMRSCPAREWVMINSQDGSAFVTRGNRPTAATAPLRKATIVGFVLWKESAWNNSAFMPKF